MTPPPLRTSATPTLTETPLIEAFGGKRLLGGASIRGGGTQTTRRRGQEGQEGPRESSNDRREARVPDFLDQPLGPSTNHPPVSCPLQPRLPLSPDPRARKKGRSLSSIDGSLGFSNPFASTVARNGTVRSVQDSGPGPRAIQLPDPCLCFEGAPLRYWPMIMYHPSKPVRLMPAPSSMSPVLEC